MDYSKIKLANERNSHVTKRLNRLNTWKFFTVLYRENIWRLFGFSILMLLCMAPIFALLVLGSYNGSSLQQGLPTLNAFGFSTGVWDGLTDYVTGELNRNNMFYALMASVAGILVTVVLSGGFAVIRDAFWTGKLSTVGVFKSIGKGIKANVFYALISSIVISFSVFGLYCFYVWGVTAMPLWLTIVLLVLLCIVDLFVVMYLLTLCSVSVTYKQSVRDNLDDSWRLLWLNILPNIIHVLIALLPIALYFVFSSGMLQSLYMVLMLMFGGMYIPLVWHSHMMRTFALFHPVEVKKKKAAKQQNVADTKTQAKEELMMLGADADEAEDMAQKAATVEPRGKKKNRKDKTQAAEDESDTANVADSDVAEEDPYAVDEND